MPVVRHLRQWALESPLDRPSAHKPPELRKGREAPMVPQILPPGQPYKERHCIPQPWGSILDACLMQRTVLGQQASLQGEASTTTISGKLPGRCGRGQRLREEGQGDQAWC